jgi:protein-S-isoprenylcysteine O-methyltransferase Ste14
MKSSPTLIKAFIIFPLNVMGVIPAFILWFSGRFQTWAFDWLAGICGALLIALGFYVIWETVSIFTDYGEGTPAPWEPPKKLVALGIYRNVRNPMMIGVWCVLAGESILFRSMELLIWFLVFYTACMVMIPLWEEKDLEKRFGESYSEYKKNVPRWIPRWKPWLGPDA